MKNYNCASYLEIIHRHSQRVEQVSINGLVLQVNQCHLLADGLQGSFRAQSSHVGTNVTMCLCRNLKEMTLDIEINFSGQ